jgi:hypothetical protein
MRYGQILGYGTQRGSKHAQGVYNQIPYEVMDYITMLLGSVVARRDIPVQQAERCRRVLQAAV